MQGISGYIYSVSSMAIVTSVISVLIPKNTAGRVAIMSVGIIMTAVVISPIRAIDINALAGYMEETEAEISEYTQRANEKNREICDEIIEENIRTYILQRSKEEDIRCDVEIDFGNGEPHHAEIFVEKSRDAEKISKIIREECGIPEVMVRIKNEEN